MILIADSGSSKTDWVTIDQNNVIIHYESVGINPFFISSEEIMDLIKKTFDSVDIYNQIERIFFYGTGCIKNHNTSVIVDGLSPFFRKASINIEDDMLGAARSLFGTKQGIACILGTGANSSKYDGKEIIEKIPALGYILGDEASGAYFGKILINNFFKKVMPEDLSRKFEEQYHPEMSEVLNKVYKQVFPNRYLAKFTHFISQNIEHQYIIDLLKYGFEAFIQNNIAKYEDYQNFNVGFVGSVAHHFSETLKRSGSENQINIIQILEKPIEGLIDYHLNNY